MIHLTYKGHDIKAKDEFHAGKIMCEIDGLEVFIRTSHRDCQLIVVKDDKVVNRIKDIGTYDFYTSYCKDHK